MILFELWWNENPSHWLNKDLNVPLRRLCSFSIQLALWNTQTFVQSINWIKSVIQTTWRIFHYTFSELTPSIGMASSEHWSLYTFERLSFNMFILSTREIAQPTTFQLKLFSLSHSRRSINSIRGKICFCLISICNLKKFKFFYFPFLSLLSVNWVRCKCLLCAPSKHETAFYIK